MLQDRAVRDIDVNANARERVRQAMRRKLDRLGMTNRAFGKMFSANKGQGHGDQWVSNLLQGKHALSLEELDEAARALKCRASDLVRDDTEEAVFLNPMEQRLIRALREVPHVIRDHFLTLAEYLLGVAPDEIDHLLEFRQLTADEQVKVRHWTHAVLLAQEPPPVVEVPEHQPEKGARPTVAEHRSRGAQRRKTK